MSFSYSFNEEDFHGDFNTREEAAKEAFAEDPEINVCWTGENVTPIPENFINAQVLIENIQCQDEFSGEWAENWPDETKEQLEELEKEIQKVFAAWLDKHSLRPAFFNCMYIEKHERNA